jgi:uncharacterized protein
MTRLSAFPAIGASRPAVGICLSLALAACGQAATDKAQPAKLSTAIAPSRPAPAGYDFPAQTGRVVDAANVLPAPVEGSISARLAALEAQSRHQLVVVTVPSLGGHDITDYARQLGISWGVGRAGVNDGMVLLVAPKERQIQLSIGDGLVHQFNDAKAREIINRDMVPALKRGDYSAGVSATVAAIVHDLMPAGGATT